MYEWRTIAAATSPASRRAPVIRLDVVEDGFRFVANIRGDARNAVTFIAYLKE
jgi:hypothetical protein